MFDTLAGGLAQRAAELGARCSGCSTAGRGARRKADDEPDGDGGDSPAWSRKREDYQRPDQSRLRSAVPYAELHAHSAYSFLDGAGTPEELVEEAARLDLKAIALTDHDGLYGVVRFAEAARELDMRTVFGAELSLGDGARTDVPDPPRSPPAGAGPRPGGLPPAVPSAGGRAPGRRREGRTALRLRRAHRGRGRALADPHRMPQRACAPGTFRRAVRRLRRRRWPTWWTGSARDRVSVELTHHGHPLDDERNAALAALAPRFGAGSSPPPARTSPGRRGGGWRWRWVPSGPGSLVDEAAGWLAPLGGAHLRSGEEMARVFAQSPEVVTAAAELGEQCAFGLQLIAPKLPPFDVPAGHTEDSWLRQLVMVGAAGRYGPPAPTRRGPTRRSSMSWNHCGS